MSQPFLAEIRIVGFNFAPMGWASCDGQILPINQSQSLYSILGTTYGGDGQTTFALPDLRGRAAMHVGNGHALGQRLGVETVALTEAEMPQHQHAVNVSDQAPGSDQPAGNVLSRAAASIYGDVGNLVDLAPGSVAGVGGSQSHNNMQPFQTLHFVIALQGLFPSHS